MAAWTFAFDVSNNEDWRDALILQTGSPAEPMDLTGATFDMDLRLTDEDAYARLHLSTANTRLQTPVPANGGLLIIVPLAVMQSVRPALYVADLRMKLSGATQVIARGTVNVHAGVSR